MQLVAQQKVVIIKVLCVNHVKRQSDLKSISRNGDATLLTFKVR
jgi:hypothetical protein